jgi:hypothetical protein
MGKSTKKVTKMEGNRVNNKMDIVHARTVSAIPTGGTSRTTMFTVLRPQGLFVNLVGNDQVCSVKFTCVISHLTLSGDRFSVDASVYVHDLESYSLLSSPARGGMRGLIVDTLAVLQG